MQLITTNIKILLKLCNINCFLPHYDEKTEEFKIRPLHHTIVFILYLVAYIYMFYIKFTLEGLLYPERRTLFVITSGTLAFIGACWLVTVTRKKRVADVQCYFDTFEEIDRSLSAIFKIKIKHKKHANLYATVILGVYVILLLISYHFWEGNIDIIQYKLHFTSDIFVIVSNMVIVLIKVYTLECMKRRYDVLVGIIRGLGLDGEKVAVISFKIDCLSRLHNALSDLVMLFDELFSWRMLGIILYTLLVDLVTLGTFVTGNYDEDKKFFFGTVLWTTLITIQVIMMAVMCERVVEAGKTCTMVTYKTMSRLSGCNPLRAKMIILGSQMEARCPKFTAAGFFDVNYAMMFTFSNLMVTYIIVIIQFDNNR